MPLNIDWQQILLHLLNFVVLFAALYFLLHKPVKQFMDKRVEYYKNLDEKAEEKLAAAEQAQAEHTQRVSELESTLAAEREAAHKELDTALAARRAQAEEEAAKIVADAKAAAQRERKKVLAEAQNEITNMVTNATEKIVLSASTSDAFDQFLAAAKRGETDE